MPDLDATIFRPFQDQGVLVYGIYGAREDPVLVEGFRQQTGVSFPLIRDPVRSLGEFAFPPGVNFPYPRDVVIGKDLRVHSIRNSFNSAEMEALIQELLAE